VDTLVLCRRVLRLSALHHRTEFRSLRLVSAGLWKDESVRLAIGSFSAFLVQRVLSAIFESVQPRTALESVVSKCYSGFCNFEEGLLIITLDTICGSAGAKRMTGPSTAASVIHI